MSTSSHALATPEPEQQEERWRPVASIAGYEVSDCGRVRSLDRVIETSTGPRRRRGGLMQVTCDANGYQRVTLSHGHPHQMYVHTLVLEAFVAPRPDGAECCHHDDDRTNNHLSNLRWDTTSANAIDRERNRRLYGPPATRKRPGANGHPCNEACGWSRKPVSQCRCLCGGARHGSFNATDAQIAAARARIGVRTAIDPFAGLPVSDEEPF